jgi:hypothetical protein
VFVACWVQHADQAAIATLLVFKFLSCKNSSLRLQDFVEVGHHLADNKLCIGKDWLSHQETKVAACDFTNSGCFKH